MTRIICSLFTVFGVDNGRFPGNIDRKRLQIRLMFVYFAYAYKSL
jgi:hypothetical protein